MSGAALGQPHAEVLVPVEALLAATLPVADRGALALHLLVAGAEVVAEQTPGQVVPQLRIVVLLARLALCLRAGRTVRFPVCARRTLVAEQHLPGHWVLVLVGGDGVYGGGGSTAQEPAEQHQHRQEELGRERCALNGWMNGWMK